MYFIYKSLKMSWNKITYNGRYARKPNQTNSYIFNIYV